MLLAQLAYAAGAIAVHRRWGRPSGDRLFASLLVSLPAPVLLHLYLYAGYLDASGRPPARPEPSRSRRRCSRPGMPSWPGN